MDGIDNPPFMSRLFTNKVNSFLDAIYVVPRRVSKPSGGIFARRARWSLGALRSSSNALLDARSRHADLRTR